jgi:hypothetical protein
MITSLVMPGVKSESKATPNRKSGRQKATKKVGRPRAKHSSPDYTQVSLYLHKEVRNKVKVRLFEQGAEFSALVESLLRDWLKR